MKKWIWLACLGCSLNAMAQSLPAIEDKVKNMTAKPGFLPMYLDGETGKIYLEINQWKQELLYNTSLPAGLGSNDIGLDRGKLGEERIIRFEQQGKKVMMIQPNYAYRAVSNDAAEKRAVEQSFAQSMLWAFTAEAATGQRVLVDATEFMLRDAVKVANTLRRSNQGSYQLDKNRSLLYLPNTRNFPLNTEIETTITFTNTDGQTGAYVRSVTPSDEAITLRMHHSFVQLPDANYKPRVFDARSSFIPMSFYDYATPVSEPIEKFYAVRHRLEKKDKKAAKSEAVKPIVYYLDNGTPEPIRSALLEGASWWNQAFEAAGYTNAFQVKILPDTADPMDIRYNMINWVHRSTRGWSYGASVVDPRTGEIIKGNVTLGSLRVRQDYLIFSALLSPYAKGLPANDPMLKAALDRLRQLSAHEVGHTLGLMHNYASSVSNRASVMDYPHPVVTLNARGEIDMSQVYDKGIGAWDKVAITWGYRDMAPGENEQTILNQVLTTAAKNGLQFISDRDARAPGGLHDDAHLWDNGRSVVEELNNVLAVRQKALDNFGENNVRPGTPMAFLEDALVPLYFYHRYQVEAVTKLVGGAHYNYALRGDGQSIYTPLPKATQLAALAAAMKTLQPEVLNIPERIANLIPPRPAGYDFNRELFKKRTGLAFDRLTPAETAADLPLSFLFHPERLNRLVQQQTTVGLGLEEVLQYMVDNTWKAPRKSGFEKQIQQQTEQVLLTYLLGGSVNDDNGFEVKAQLQQALENLKVWLTEQVKTSTAADKAHYQLAIDRMKSPDKAKPTLHKEAPPGAPIGCEVEF